MILEKLMILINCRLYHQQTTKIKLFIIIWFDVISFEIEIDSITIRLPCTSVTIKSIQCWNWRNCRWLNGCHWYQFKTKKKTSSPNVDSLNLWIGLFTNKTEKTVTSARKVKTKRKHTQKHHYTTYIYVDVDTQ